MSRSKYLLVLTLTTSTSGMMIKDFRNKGEFNSLFNPNFEDYYDYEEPLPQGPTRPPAKNNKKNQKKVVFPEDDYYYYEDEEPLPQGPTREPPLPSGPTRRPDQPTTLDPRRTRPVNPALNQFLSLPLLTTKRPRKLKGQPKKGLQKKVIDEFGPFEAHFIAPPQINAGALPLAVSEDLPLFPPFNKVKKSDEDKNDEE